MKPQTKAEATKKVPTHVIPKACFVWHHNAKTGWIPIPGTGCAHWVAHEQKITGFTPNCGDGCAIRVVQVISGKSVYTIAHAKLGDIWTNARGSHCGIVIKVYKNKDKNKDEDNDNESATVTTSVDVKHCSSGSGGVVIGYKWTKGLFYR